LKIINYNTIIMTKLFLIICPILFSASVSCQNAQAPVTNNRDTTDLKQAITASGEPIFIKVEKEAEFSGGSQAWVKYLMNKLDPKIPLTNGAPGGSYPVMVKFVVLKTGKILDCEAITDFGYGMEKAVVKLI